MGNRYFRVTPNYLIRINTDAIWSDVKKAATKLNNWANTEYTYRGPTCSSLHYAFIDVNNSRRKKNLPELTPEEFYKPTTTSPSKLAAGLSVVGSFLPGYGKFLSVPDLILDGAAMIAEPSVTNAGHLAVDVPYRILNVPGKVDDYIGYAGLIDDTASAIGLYKIGGLFTFPTNLLTKNLKRISGVSNRRNPGIPKSDRPMYNSNRIIKKADEGLKFANIETVVPDALLVNLLPMKLLPLYSDLNRFKDISEIMKEVTLKYRKPFNFEVPSANSLQQMFETQLTDSVSKYLNIPYVYGGKSTKGIDCSGFTLKVFEDMGIHLPGGSINLFNSTLRVSAQEAKVGDLIFLKGTNTKDRSASSISHVAIVKTPYNPLTGELEVWEASGAGSKSSSKVWNIDKGYYKNHFAGFGRIKA